METVAMYWEPQIKTYGFQVTKNLTLHRVAISPDRFAKWDLAGEERGNGENHFLLICAQLKKASRLDLLLLRDPRKAASLDRRLESELSSHANCRHRVVTPVELLFFQGPHYGDRFGIADFTYQALGKYSQSMLATAFSCASVYLIFPEGVADKAKTLLAAKFRIPGNPNHE